MPNSRWALRDFGFRAILATSFADIFAANCTNNGIAAMAMNIDAIARCAEQRERYELTIDLEACQIRDERASSHRSKHVKRS